MMDSNRKAYLKQYRQTYSAERINLTVSKDEYRLLMRAATKENSKLAPYVKKLAISTLLQQAHIPQEIQQELQTLRFAILNIANNINQIAHHSNYIRAMSEDKEHSLLVYIKQLDDVVKSYTQGRILNTHHHDN